MAITNAEIVTMEQLRLLEEGILHYTGRKLKGTNMLTGEECEIDEIQPLNTIAAWNKLGYKVIKGEHPIAQFSIWKYSNRKPKEEDGEEVQKSGRGYCYMKMSNFFTDTQVVKMTPEELEKRNKRWNKW